jgi:hypothetical protein
MATLAASAALSATSSLSAMASRYPSGTLPNPASLSVSVTASFPAPTIADPRLLPPVVDGDATPSRWFAWQPTLPLTSVLTWTGSFPVGLEVWSAPVVSGLADYADMTLVSASSAGSIEVNTAPGIILYIRVHPLTATTGSGTLMRTDSDRVIAELTLNADEGVEASEGFITVNVGSATPDAILTFTIDGGQEFTAVADETGSLIASSIPVAGLDQGTYTLSVRDEAGLQTASVSFDAYWPHIIRPVMGGPPTVVLAMPGAGEIQRWVFFDPKPGGEQYVVPVNPDSMSSPHTQRVLSTGHTTRPDGQVLVWEGTVIPADWTITGTVLDRDHYDALERFQALSNRIWIVDHLNRGWLCTFETLEWTQKRAPGYPWMFAYQAQFKVYDGPVAVPKAVMDEVPNG